MISQFLWICSVAGSLKPIILLLRNSREWVFTQIALYQVIPSKLAFHSLWLATFGRGLLLITKFLYFFRAHQYKVFAIFLQATFTLIAVFSKCHQVPPCLLSCKHISKYSGLPRQPIWVLSKVCVPAPLSGSLCLYFWQPAFAMVHFSFQEQMAS